MSRSGITLLLLTKQLEDLTRMIQGKSSAHRPNLSPKPGIGASLRAPRTLPANVSNRHQIIWPMDPLFWMERSLKGAERNRNWSFRLFQAIRFLNISKWIDAFYKQMSMNTSKEKTQPSGNGKNWDWIWQNIKPNWNFCFVSLWKNPSFNILLHLDCCWLRSYFKNWKGLFWVNKIFDRKKHRLFACFGVFDWSGVNWEENNCICNLIENATQREIVQWVSSEGNHVGSYGEVLVWKSWTSILNANCGFFSLQEFNSSFKTCNGSILSASVSEKKLICVTFMDIFKLVLWQKLSVIYAESQNWLQVLAFEINQQTNEKPKYGI